MEGLHSLEKPPNYRRTANWFSAMTLCWTFHIFELGRKRDLLITDLPDPLPEHEALMLGEKIAHVWSAECEKARRLKESPNLGKVLCKCFWVEYIRYGIVLAVMDLLLKPINPLFLGLLLRYYSTENMKNNYTGPSPRYFGRLINYTNPNQTPVVLEEAYVYAACLIALTFISVVMQHPYMYAVMHLGMKVRVACNSLMYRKTLRMSLMALNPATVGNIINLMSNDVIRFDVSPMFIHYLWSSPLQMIIICAVLYEHIGVSSFIGMAIMCLFIPTQIFMAHKNKELRWKTAFKTDERVRLMNEIISGIQVIKMYAWEYAFAGLIQNARRQELNILVQTSYIRGMIMSFIMFTTRSAIFFTVLSYVLIGNDITSEKVFVITAYYVLLRQSMTLYFPQGVTQFAETLVTIKRTRKYLMSEEAIIGDTTILDPITPRKKHVNTLHQLQSVVSLEAIPIDKTSIRIVEAYARWHDQKKFVLRDVEFTITDYHTVVLIGATGSGKSTLLNVILKELPVEIGYVSVKGTVSYASQDPWLFAGSVRQNILFGHEWNKERYKKVIEVCALVRDFKILPYGDQTIVGERGISLSGGQRARINLARCIYKEADIYLLDDPLSAVDTQVGAHIFHHCINSFLKHKIVVLVTHQLQFLYHVDKIIIMEHGSIKATGNYEELQKSGLDFAKLLKDKTTDDDSSDSDEDDDKGIKVKEVSVPFMSQIQININSVTEYQEVTTTGKVNLQIYKDYFLSGSHWSLVSFTFFMFLAAQGLASGSDYFISQWTAIEEHKKFADPSEINSIYMHSENCIIGYSILTSFLIVVCTARGMIFYTVCLRISLALHSAMFRSVVFGKMRFFNTNTSGRILNRFSKDMGAVDEDLPYAMLDFIQITLNLIGVAVVVSIINFYLLLPTLLMCVLFYLLRKYYLMTGTSVKRLEGVARSPVYAHLNASLQGLTTIRSHNAERILCYEFDKHQDVHSSAWFFYIATSRAFSVWLDSICTLFISLCTYHFFLYPLGTYMAGDIGLGITQCLTLNGLFPWGMRQSAEMENQMTSVERVLEYTKIEHEPSLESTPDKKPPPTWPEAGEIIFQNVVMRYSQNSLPVLRDLNFTINAGEKVGIVGRTGAGKSSLIGTLFRLAYVEGGLFIDGINIIEIGLHDLRSKISIIPQEPIIFSGTMRYNLDPFHQCADEEILRALSLVDLETGSRDILNSKITEGGSNFSSGQKQMLCLARAIVRNNRILILDEATANVDPQTDQLIQKTIRNTFSQCTVLTIAHRLNTIMDSDRVLVVDEGRIVEFDHPHILLQNEYGFFSGMVNRTGKNMAEQLKNEAYQSYLKKTDPSVTAEEFQIDNDDNEIINEPSIQSQRSTHTNRSAFPGNDNENQE